MAKSSPSVIKEFLAALGFQLDEPGLRKFETSLGRATKVATELGEALTLTATTIGIGVSRITEQFGDLYYATQRLGGTIQNLQSFQFAAAQIGISSDRSRGALESFMSVMRQGVYGPMFRGLAGAAFDPRNPEHSLMLLMQRLYTPPGTTKFNLRRAQAAMFGVGEEDFIQMGLNAPQYFQHERDVAGAQQRAGFDPEKFGAQAVEFNRDLNDMIMNLDVLRDAFVRDVIGPADAVVRAIGAIARAMQSLDSATGGTFGKVATVGGTALGSWLTVKTLTGMARRFGILGPAAAGGGGGFLGGLLGGAARLLGGPAAFLSGVLVPSDPGAPANDEDAISAALRARAAGMTRAQRWQLLTGGGAGGLVGAADAAARQAGVDPVLFRALIGRESTWNQRAVSDRGAIGLTQLMPNAAARLGVDASDPYQNLQGGARWLAMMIRQHGGNVADALADYNAGAAHLDWGRGYAADVMADAASGISRGMPSGALVPPAAGGGGVPVTVTQHNTITVSGVSDPHAAAAAAVGGIGQVNNTLVRNLASVTR